MEERQRGEGIGGRGAQTRRKERQTERMRVGARVIEEQRTKNKIIFRQHLLRNSELSFTKLV